MADVKELNINSTTYDIKAKSIVDTNSGSLKFWSGTKSQYDAIVTKDSNTLYNITDDEVSANTFANLNLNNVTDTANVLMAHNAMPSNTYKELELGASGTKYTATADGWVTLGKRASAADQNIGLYLHGENDIELAGVKAISYTSEFMAVTIPVRKNQKFSTYYNAGGSTSYFRFIYAAGSESEA